MQDEINGGLSLIVGKVLNVFFGMASTSFRSGFRCLDASRAWRIVTGRLGYIIQDEKAFKFTFSVKGASGYKPCYFCKNVVKCHPSKLVGNPYAKHLNDALPHELDFHTSASFYELADHLEREFATMSPSAFEKEEIAAGLTYDPLGMIWDRIRAGPKHCSAGCR